MIEIAPISAPAPSQSTKDSLVHSQTSEDFVPTTESLEAGFYAEAVHFEGSITELSRTKSTDSSELQSHLLSIQFEVSVLTFSYGVTQDDQDLKQSLFDALPPEIAEKIEGYLEEFDFSEGLLPDSLSPENVSQRIVDFSLSAYSFALDISNDSLESRNDYVNYITPAIDQGIDDAIEILDPFLTEDVRDLIEQTRDLIYEKLDQFRGVDVEA